MATSTTARGRPVYRGEALRALTLPLGGIGTGSIALAGDGGLRQWQMVNNVNHDAHVPNSFFAIGAVTRGDGRRGAVVLQSDALYGAGAFQAAPSVTDHVVPSGSRRLLAQLPGAMAWRSPRDIRSSRWR